MKNIIRLGDTPLESLQLRRNFSRNVIIRMLLAASLVTALLIWKLDFINEVYFRNQLTSTGLIINGAILGLFIVGLIRIIFGLIGYHQEEKALGNFMQNLQDDVDPLTNLDDDNKIIVRRYRTLHGLHRANTPINHSALATTLVASESTRNSFPKFVNNILILCGVFGTIVSLSIALTGATDLLASAANVDGMGIVVHGMSTALSTTITAIVCYLFFGYFYMKLTDAQTNLVSAIEEATATHLLPIFQIQTESILFEFSGLIRSLQGLINQMESSQKSYQELASEMQGSQNAFAELETHIGTALKNVYDTRIHPITDEMTEIKHLLKIGFRLPEEK
ncbi:MAG: hypothetical protein ABW148_05595 [Sedimenticola sp.]